MLPMNEELVCIPQCRGPSFLFGIIGWAIVEFAELIRAPSIFVGSGDVGLLRR